MFLSERARPSNVGENTRKKEFTVPSSYQKWLQPFFWETFSHRLRKRCRKDKTKSKRLPEPITAFSVRLGERFGLKLTEKQISSPIIACKTSMNFYAGKVCFANHFGPCDPGIGTEVRVKKKRKKSRGRRKRAKNTRKKGFEELCPKLRALNPYTGEPIRKLDLRFKKKVATEQIPPPVKGDNTRELGPFTAEQIRTLRF